MSKRISIDSGGGPNLRRLTALLLVFHLLSPLAPTIAQETGTPASDDQRTGATPDRDQSGSVDVNESDAEATEGAPLPTLTKSGDSEDAADSAETSGFFKGDGAAQDNDIASVRAAAATGESGSFQSADFNVVKPIIPEPDPTTGALIYSYSLTVPPGRNGMTPELNLTYNSQDSKMASYLGDRWSLSIPYIERLNKTGTDRIYIDDFFSSSLSGELALISGMAYAPRVEDGHFLKYRYDGMSWTVTDKAGTVYKFGAQPSTRQDDPSDATRVFRWMLEEARDTNGNFIAYAYYKDDGQIYPEAITYTGNGTANGIFKVLFTRGFYDNTSPSLYYPDFKVKTAYRVTSISTMVSGEWVRRYDLGYAAADQGYRPVLASIVESGRDLDTGTITSLPAATFGYKARGPLGWDQVTNWQMPRWFVDRVGESTMIQIQDINGDSYPDVAYADAGLNVSPQGVYVSNSTTGWNADDASWPFPIWIKGTSGFKDNGTRIFDVNGDLLADVVRSFSTSSGDVSPAASSVYLNSGDPATGWGGPSSIIVPIGFVFGAKLYADDAVRVMDVNGDGIADLVRAYLDDDYPGGFLNQSVHLGTGSGWTAAAPDTWQVPFPIIDENPYGSEVYTFAQFVDVNGDSLPDILWRYSYPGGYWWSSNDSSSSRTFINNGHGWEPNTGSMWATPMPFEASQYIQYGRTDTGARATDLNGDGVQDIIYSAFVGTRVDSYAYLNSGQEAPYPYTQFNPEYALVPEALATSNKATNPKVQLADVNADGLDDFLYSERNRDNVFLTRTHLARPNSFTDLLTNITAPTGGAYAVTYKLSNQYRNGDNSLASPKLPLVIPTVERITATDTVMGVSGTSTWSYADGTYYHGSPTDRRFAGFGQITRTDPAGNVTKTYYHQGNASNASQGEYNDNPAKIGRPYRVEQYDNAGNLYAATVNRWDQTTLGAGRDFVKLAAVTTLTFDGNSTHADAAQEFSYDTYGNLTQRTHWGRVAANTDGSFTDIGSDKSTEISSYALNTTNYVVGLPCQSTVLDQSSYKVRETKTYYDNLALGLVGTGNPTRVERWVGGTDYVSSQKAYNTVYGIVTSETDPRGKATAYTYDSYNLYPAIVIDPLTHSRQYLYDYSSGKPKQVTDQNGFDYQTIYDGLDRVREEKVPDLTSPHSTVAKTTYAYTDAANAFKLQRSDHLNASVTVETYHYVDGFGRLVQERREAESPGSFNVKDTVWNGVGLVQKQSLPYAGSGSARTSHTATASLYTTYAYDALGRPLTTTDAVGATTYAYDDWRTTVTDAEGKVKRYYRDASGNLAKVDEVSDGSTYETRYEWNANGKLTKITDALGNVRLFIYDGLGRRLAAEDLHEPADATYGTWTYAYDDAGNLSQAVSPSGRTTNYFYDDTNQVFVEDDAGTGGTEITYAYGGCANGIGRLCSVIMTSGANSSYTYSSSGSIASETKAINGGVYTTSYAYDRQGNILTITYPDGAEVRNTFNTAGLLEKIERRESGGSFIDTVLNFDYSPMGQIASQAYPNGVTTTNAYDATKLYRLTRRLTQNAAGTKLQDLNYTYDKVGNITQIVDASNTESSKTVNYAYDDLHRLTLAAAANTANGSDYTHAYAHDALGNLTSGPAGAYLYQGHTGSLTANPHAATSVDGATYSYDGDGNLTGDGTLTNAWNYKAQLTQTTIGASTFFYYYDHNGDRVHYMNGATSGGTIYPNRHYNTNGTKKTKQIYAGDQLVATVETAGTVVTPYYVHIDQLDSTTAVSDGAGSLAQTLDYYPFGAQRFSSGTHDEQRRYIGQIHDVDTGLDYLNARYYSASIGRFISQDPAFWDIGGLEFEERYKRALNLHLMNPQALNSYLYALNNPLAYKDPQGEIVPVAFLAAWAVVEAGLTVYDAYSTYQTINNKSLAAEDKALAVTGFAVGLLAPGGGYGKLSSAAAKYLSRGVYKGGLKLGEDLGKIGKVVWPTAGKVTAFDPHGLMRMGEKSVSESLIRSTVRDPLVKLDQGNGKAVYLTERAGVVVDSKGIVVTTYGANYFEPEVINIITRATKNTDQK